MSSVRTGILTPEGCGVLSFNRAVHLSMGSWAVFSLGIYGIVVVHGTALGTVLR